MQIRPLKETTLASLSSFNHDDWNSLTQWVRAVIKCKSSTVSEEDAQDLCQEILIKLNAFAEKSKNPKKYCLEPYVRAMVRNHLIDFYRANAKERKVISSGEGPDVASVDFDLSYVSEAIRSLGPKERESIEDIAFGDVLGPAALRLTKLEANKQYQKRFRIIEKARHAVLRQRRHIRCWPKTSVKNNLAPRFSS